LITTTLKGAENLELYENLHKKGKPTITIQLLGNIGTENRQKQFIETGQTGFLGVTNFGVLGKLTHG
jgi:hypothetical protein